MEHHSTHTNAGRLPHPRDTAAATATARRTPRRPAERLTRLRGPRGPRRLEPRLTALGTGLSLTAVALGGGALDTLMFGEPGVFFGVVFVFACVAAALLVRPYDLSAAPISAPIAFTVAVALTADSGTGGVAGHAMGAVTALALLTGWLYTGTLLAAAIVGVRKVADVRKARRRPDRASQT
ncbi:DUF6542 domain-containing protein [Actinacidiphila soli]|uniref:DUF6542 domain-containing protein n=1 Tax=Actinacidiphila soli TaxID=2487275 RepID=UPI000FCA5E56|nr:DUF6542 domain-containing protein [Actinacidiphila soli]